MLFVKASVLRGDFFVEKPEVLSPDADIIGFPFYAVSLFSVCSVLQNMDVRCYLSEATCMQPLFPKSPYPSPDVHKNIMKTAPRVR